MPGAKLLPPRGAGGGGDVVGPAGAVDSDIAEFDGATGRLIKDGALAHVAVANAVAASHAQNTDTGLGVLGVKNPPIDADKVIYRDSTAGDALVTSTWLQVKAFLKTWADTIYDAIGAAAAALAAALAALAVHAGLTTGVHGVGANFVAQSSVGGLDLAAHHTRHEFGGADKVVGDPLATPSSLVYRDGAGRTQMVAPAVNADVDIKGSRDTAIATHAAITSGIHGLNGGDAWYAYKTGTQSVASGGAATKITWEATLFDVGGHFDTVNDRWVAPFNCYLIVTVCLSISALSAANSYERLYFYIDGVALNAHYSAYSDWGTHSHLHCSVIYLASGSRVEVYFLHNSGVAENVYSGSPYSWFSGAVLPQP